LDDLLAHVEGLALIAMDGDAALLERLRAATQHLWLSAAMQRGGSDARDLAERMALAEACGVPLIATNDPLYAVPAQRPCTMC
jgi:error-prone DNA polymerase